MHYSHLIEGQVGRLIDTLMGEELQEMHHGFLRLITQNLREVYMRVHVYHSISTYQ
jgi:hypothetical protein